MYYLIFGPIALALAYTVSLALWLKKQPSGNEKMQEISKATQEGALAFLLREYRVLAIFAVIVAIIIVGSEGEETPSSP